MADASRATRHGGGAHDHGVARHRLDRTEEFGAATSIAFTRRNQGIWWETRAKDRDFYIGYNDAGVDAAEAITAMEAALDSGAADRVILDVRYARGGSFDGTVGLRSALADDPRIEREGSLIVLIGREDVSATTALISQLDQDNQAVFVGEPTPARPNTMLDETTRLAAYV